MYRSEAPGQLSFADFYLPFGGKLSEQNRWVKLARMNIPAPRGEVSLHSAHKLRSSLRSTALFELCYLIRPRGARNQTRERLIPWEEFEQEYASQLDERIGAPAKSFRMALGALIIKERLGSSVRETVEQLRENPYLQYFLGLSEYSDQAPFDASMMVHFRQRLSLELVG